MGRPVNTLLCRLCLLQRASEHAPEQAALHPLPHWQPAAELAGAAATSAMVSYTGNESLSVQRPVRRGLQEYPCRGRWCFAAENLAGYH